MRRASLVALTLAALGGCETHLVLVTPVDAGPLDAGSFARVDGLAMGVDHTCALVESVLACTGDGSAGQLGLRDTTDRAELTIVDTSPRYVAVTTGYRTTCVLTVGGDVLCTGAGARGQLGQGDLVDRSVLSRVELPGEAVRISAHFEHACAILRDGSLHCWGSNIEGELGQGDTYPGEDATIPQAVAPELAFVDVAAGQGHTCAIAIDGSLYCWGRNTSGELGLGASAGEQTRAPMRVGTGRYERVVAGQSHTCAITSEGQLACWGSDAAGDGHAGPVGLVGDADVWTPTVIDTGTDWIDLATDTFHTCAVRSSGALACWGRNAEGELGTGDTSVVETPREVAAGSTWARVAVGRFATCAQATDGSVYCTGANGDGELGTGDTDPRTSWTRARGLE